ncbi:serine hydrolase [Nocardia arthritidis]|uniref:Serine hydrolase n=1 Tax=Nocardia arthritidis TaxID=228602 RepID=A0A6G9YQB0_9NOCA|nr:serine hydrolase [Nocardia arthritidis]QIS15392.1 hypothetical protein F5544_37830 [Nocardia arthritidis]
MGYRRVALAAVVGAGICLACAATRATAAEPEQVPQRTAISLRSTIGLHWGTANEHEARSGLSLTKLYIVDYALRHGDGSALDRELSERMIRLSDDRAADLLSARYPAAIDAIAKEFHLHETQAGPDWGSASTSAADVADFLEQKLHDDPASPIFEWMTTASSIAADGTEQDWGTSHMPGVLGSKWGWSDYGPPEVASTSYGPWFAVAAHTHGTAAEETADVLDALPELTRTLFPLFL